MTTANDILTQLEEQYAQAERHANARPGDTVIYRRNDGVTPVTYEVTEQDAEYTLAPGYRILERAKPKAPEWEAVVASDLHDETHKREVYFRTADGGWESETRLTCADDLVDPAPLVELPEREDLLAAFEEGWQAWKSDEMSMRGADSHRADAVLKLLKRR